MVDQVPLASHKRAAAEDEAQFDDMANIAVAVAAVPAPSDCCLLRARGSNPTRQSGVAQISPLQRNGAPKILVSRSRQSMKSISSRPRSLVVRAAKLPAGVEAPIVEPKLPVSLWGFTEKAEVWNSRAAMIGIFALVALEFFAHKGILQLIGVDVGKGLDIPL